MRLRAVQSMANYAIHLVADQLLSFEPISLAATGDRGVPCAEFPNDHDLTFTMRWMIINGKIKGVYLMQSTIEIKHLSRKEKLRMMEAFGKTCREKMKSLF